MKSTSQILIWHDNAKCSNKEAKYHTLIVGLELWLEHGARNVKIYRNSQLVIKQIIVEYRCINTNMAKYLAILARLLHEFDNCIVKHMPMIKNEKVNKLA